MRVAAVLLFVFSILGFIVAVGQVTAGENRPETFQQFLSFGMGYFVFPIFLLGMSFWCWGRARKSA